MTKQQTINFIRKLKEDGASLETIAVALNDAGAVTPGSGIKWTGANVSKFCCKNGMRSIRLKRRRDRKRRDTLVATAPKQTVDVDLVADVWNSNLSKENKIKLLELL